MNLTADNGRMLYVPRGFAHGFQTLADETDVYYQVSECHVPEAERGLRWDDPAVAIDWPLPVEITSAKDATWPDLASTGAIRRAAARHA